MNDDPVALLLSRPHDTCIATDFDGTLAPIVPDPASARPLPGAGVVLNALTTRFGAVAVVSGRPAAFLATALGFSAPLPEALRVVGLYGLEELDRDGSVRSTLEAEAYRGAVASARADAQRSAPPGARVEDKGLTLTLHWREDPAHQRWAEREAQAAAHTYGLGVHPAKMSVELRPPVSVDKGSAFARLLEGRRAACFLGDDVGDLPAFAALDGLASRGGDAVRVAVRSEESPAELIAAADVVVDGPGGALSFLRSLAG